MAKLRSFFPKSHGKPRVAGKHALSENILCNFNVLRWSEASGVYGLHKILYNRWKRWSEKGFFAGTLLELADQALHSFAQGTQGSDPAR